ncbi:MAG: hypothetical protein AB9903_22570 [Vulcanimicrobiota bacterium]
MPVITVPMPELKDSADALVNKMSNICANGGGEIPLGDVVTFIPHLPAQTLVQIAVRGSIVFAAGAFTNHGGTIDAVFGHDGSSYRIEVPVDIKGSYGCYNNGFYLTFDHDNSILIGKRFFISWVKYRLERMDVNGDRIFIDMEGNAPDILITL